VVLLYQLPADELRWISMATQAPFHMERVLSPHQRHLLHGTMTCFTGHSLPNVNAVVEVNEVRKVVHSGPPDRFLFAEARADRFQKRAVGPDLRVTIHAGFGWWNPRERARFDRRVAVSAIDADSGDVMFVTEGNRLVAYDADFSKVR